MSGRLCILFTLLLAFGSTLAQVNPCTQDTAFHIVVLGSSTAAGAGASPADSAWVNRYRSYLQSLNPAYQVTNRAQGGFVTYRLMPTGYLPPSGRPDPDTTRNITYAIGLNPDAIIVNLPSNDVSSGYTVAEQLANFDTLHARATQAGIPIWICTTQPKNYSSSTNIQKQVEVRDSIWARFSPRVLDFWSGLADSTNQIDPAFDSGDGTHLNNSGHYLLFSRTRDADLPAQLYQPQPYPDLSAFALRDLYLPTCGDSQATLNALYLNRGLADSLTSTAQVQITHLPSNTSQTLSVVLNTPATCAVDSFPFTFNATAPGTYRIQLLLQRSGDLNSGNDTLTENRFVLGTPMLTVTDDTACTGGVLNLTATAQTGDSIRWWDQATGGNLLGTGNTYTTPTLGTTTTYYAEALRGDFFFRNSLSTTTNSNVNWNGAMFDLVADSNLVVDSFALKINSPGAQTVRLYTRPGSHLGYETSPTDWNLVGDFSVLVNNPGDFLSIGPTNQVLAQGDTLGVYLHLVNSASNLSYQSVSNPIQRSNDELTVITGSGASFNFGGNFYPRDWNGEVFYHFGNLPEGECQSPRVPVTAAVSSPQVDLGNDTILNLGATYTLDAGPGMSAYLWSDGSTSQTLLLDGNQLGSGIYTIVGTVTDSLGCTASDTVIVVFAPLVNQEIFREMQLRVWPQPARNQVCISGFQVLGEIKLMNLQGQLVLEKETTDHETCLNLTGLAPGVYLLDLPQHPGSPQKILIR